MPESKADPNVYPQAREVQGLDYESLDLRLSLRFRISERLTKKSKTAGAGDDKMLK